MSANSFYRIFRNLRRNNNNCNGVLYWPDDDHRDSVVGPSHETAAAHDDLSLPSKFGRPLPSPPTHTHPEFLPAAAGRCANGAKNERATFRPRRGAATAVYCILYTHTHTHFSLGVFERGRHGGVVTAAGTETRARCRRRRH